MEGLNAFDTAIQQFVQGNFHNPTTDRLFPFITYLGENGYLWIGIALILLFFKKLRPCGILMLASMLAGLLVGEFFLKNVVCRERPFQQFPEIVTLLIPPPSGFSFPSGHSASSFAAATTIFCFHKKWGIAALAMAGLIAFSRIFLFVHFPTDVLAGILLGAVSAWIAFFLYKRKFLKHSPIEQPEK